MSNDKSKRYNIAATVRKAIHAQAMLGHQDVVCSAILSRRGKKLNSIDRSPNQKTRIDWCFSYGLDLYAKNLQLYKKII